MINIGLSIIVPVYNIENDIPNCLNSILSQDYENYEVLLINDGSTDKSGEIIEKYALKDKRFKVFHQENKGVSSARNLGLEKAKGYWVCFIDGDDTIYPNSLSQIIESIKGKQTEMIIARSFVVENNQLKREDYGFDNSFVNRFFNGYQLITEKSFKRGSVCGCVFNLFFLKKHNVHFPTGLKIGEDSLFIALIHLYSQQITFVDQIFYLINERPGSASRNWTHEKILGMVKNLDFINYYQENNPQLSKSQLEILDFDRYGITSSIFNNFYYCFSLRLFFKLLNEIKKKLPTQINTGSIKLSKHKIKLLNFSLSIFAITVIVKQFFTKKFNRST